MQTPARAAIAAGCWLAGCLSGGQAGGCATTTTTTTTTVYRMLAIPEHGSLPRLQEGSEQRPFSAFPLRRRR
ncbi:hypothetical protein B0T17DRAFT_47595 [Bombardia bombarda]|uniref:Secreted protein n=1 Tax=Bombardia bombarda TaxID=252184 RepID=A0AA39XKZ6_9PEZI|nr:hypothetical protein B0T17DRAFT_47595 [Bombardia bombarda]